MKNFISNAVLANFCKKKIYYILFSRFNRKKKRLNIRFFLFPRKNKSNLIFFILIYYIFFFLLKMFVIFLFYYRSIIMQINADFNDLILMGIDDLLQNISYK